MYAKSLERLLHRYFRDAEMGNEAGDSFERRFKALRGCNLVPMGRENRNQELSDEQIARAVLSAVATQPDWAGFETIVLAKLQPTGGPVASFMNAATLLDAVGLLLRDTQARKSFVTMTLSTAEWGTNSHGYALITYLKDDGSLFTASFVSHMAISLLQPGAESEVTPFPRYALAARELVLSRSFFDELAREIELSRLYKSVPDGDGSEYTAEELEAARRKKLSVRPSSRYLNIGVDAHVNWPSTETLVKFDDYELVLMPRTKDKSASIHIDYVRFRLTSNAARTIINRFLSLMAWVDDQYAVGQDGWGGNSTPVAVPKRELAAVTAYGWYFDRKIPASDDARRALALYREARNAQMNFMVSYAVLNFYKILEIKYPKGPQTREWIASTFSQILPNLSDEDLARFDALRAGQAPEKYIYDACRLAVAHASSKSPSDPDDKAEILRLHLAADILRWLSRYLIANELMVSEKRVET